MAPWSFFFNQKILIIFLFVYDKICFEYLLDSYNRIMDKSNVHELHGEKNGFLISKLKIRFFFPTKNCFYFFLICLWKSMLWYSLEAPRWGASYEYSQYMF